MLVRVRVRGYSKKVVRNLVNKTLPRVIILSNLFHYFQGGPAAPKLLLAPVRTSRVLTELPSYRRAAKSHLTFSNVLLSCP